MSHEGAAFAQHSVLSPPLLAAIDSQHVFGPYDASQTPRDPPQLETSSGSRSTHPHGTHRRTRSRASSAASVHSLSNNNTAASSSTQANAHRRTRRGQNAAHSRSGSNSISTTAPNRAATSNALSPAAPVEASRPLTARLRNRSIPNLDGLRSLSTREHSQAAQPSAYTAPSSPLLSAAASIALAMSPVAHASGMPDHLAPSDWALDGSLPTTPHTALSRNASDYFDPALLAHLQSHDSSSHPELCAARNVPSPPLDTAYGRLPSQASHATRSASQSEWAQHAAHMQQTAQLLGLQRLFASRSTPHLPDLDSNYLGHDFESPPPYAPRAAAHETELERAADVDNAASGLAASSTTTSAGDPPLPPPISIPSGSSSVSASGPLSANASARPPLRARSSSRGSRSGPPSPSASFYGRRGLTSLSPFPAGLEMTPSVMHVAQFASTPASPGFAPDSDGDEDQGVLSFSSSRSKQRRDERRLSAAGEGAARGENASGLLSASLPGASSSQAGLARRRRSGSTGSVRQLLRPRTPVSTAVRDQVSVQQLASGSSAPGTEVGPAHAGLSTHSSALTIGQGAVDRDDTSMDADSVSQPVSPTSDSTRPDSPLSFTPHHHVPKPNYNTNGHAADLPTPTSAAGGTRDEDEEFPLVLKLLLHPLRILAAVPGCIGTFWLARNAYLLAQRPGHLLSPGPVLVLPSGARELFREGAELGAGMRLGRRQPGALDFAVACLWSLSTAYHALSFTTLLLRRWLLYYSILPSIIRLVALQAICWPLVRLTVHVFGPDQPLGAWVVIGTTTALSDVVSRWVTSNIADAPLDDEVDEDEQEDDALGYLSDGRFGQSPRRAMAEQHRIAVGEEWDRRSGDESDAAAASFFASERERQRKQRRGGQGTRFWRAVIGGPSFAAPKRRKAKRSAEQGGGGMTETEVESDWPGYATDHTVLGSEGLRRRAVVGGAEAAPEVARRTVLPPFPFRPSKVQGRPRFVFRAGVWTRDRTSSRRNFHWEVAVWRNVLPIAGLAYLSMWILILDAMRLAA